MTPERVTAIENLGEQIHAFTLTQAKDGGLKPGHAIIALLYAAQTVQDNMVMADGDHKPTLQEFLDSTDFQLVRIN